MKLKPRPKTPRFVWVVWEEDKTEDGRKGGNDMLIGVFTNPQAATRNLRPEADDIWNPDKRVRYMFAVSLRDN